MFKVFSVPKMKMFILLPPKGGQWHSKEGVSPAAPQWIQYEFNQPASVCQITFKPRHVGNGVIDWKTVELHNSTF